MEYTYDASGLRTGRSGGGKNYQYVYSGSQLRKMTVDGHTLIFDYDASGRPLTVVFGGYVYFYVTNLQGDVVGIVDGSGELAAGYTYNAWGECYETGGSHQSTLGQLNPLRYRGYVYDRETSLYYLQSRYYNPQWGRFLNADGLLDTSYLAGQNLFAYCGNDPINFADEGGTRREYVRDFGGVASVPTLAETVRQELLTNGYSTYNGVLVLRIDELGYGGFSFGVIGIGSDNLTDPDFEKTLNHEYGHYVHMQQVGAADYLITTAIPSLIFAEMTNQGVFPIERYYDLPWERIADQFGGVYRGYCPESNTFGSLYWITTLVYSSITPW